MRWPDTELLSPRSAHRPQERPSAAGSGHRQLLDSPADRGDRSTRAAWSTGLKVAWSLAGLTLVLWSLRLFGYVDEHPFLTVPEVLLVAWGLATIVVTWRPRQVSRPVARVLAALTLALALAGFVTWSVLQVLHAPAYGTDEIAFDQYAASLVRQGFNPYTHSMAPAFSQFHVSPDGYTFLLDGRPVTSLSYPALSFLAYVPFLALGWSTQLAVGINVLAWAASIVVLFLLLPRPLRPLAIVVGSLSVYVSYAVGGVTDALFVPLLVGAVYRWDSFASERGPAAWRGPLLLGLAMAVKQTPWLVLPFLAGGIALDAYRGHGGHPDAASAAAKVTARYLAIALAAFLAPNLPFLVAAPRPWLSGILTPVASHTVPAGQGLVGLSLFLGVGGGSLGAYTLALVVAFCALWASYLATYPRMKAWAVLLPSLVLFFGARSFGSYLVMLLPAAMVAAFSVDLSGNQPVSPRAWLCVGAGALACLAAVVHALAARPPLEVRIDAVHTTGQLATVVEVGVRVTNASAHAQRPAFTVESGGQVSAFWLATGGPATLAPGASAQYTLLAPNFFAQPPITGGFQVVAFTASPATVSRSGAYLPTSLHVGLVPNAVNRVVPVGQEVVVRAELLDNLDRRVAVAGEPVYLGQVIYSQQGLVFGEAVINQGQVGQTPVVAYTDSRGVATFTIRGTRPSRDPVYFEANLVNPYHYYPYGYSEILPIRFGTAQ
ncbi:MAG TPA: hypothetical protein VKY15_08960 [Acidimicrobiales bacterium]|nr:hypothetical protein [Acidimicrobiales bacterium]